MRYIILIAATSALFASTMVQAQDVIINDPSVTAGEVNSNAGAAASNDITGLDANIVFEGSKQTDKLETTPNVTPPSLVGGNPCAIGASLGGSIVGFGISGAVMKEGDRCELRQSVALLANMGFVGQALVMFCMGNADIEETFTKLGYGCTDLVNMDPKQMDQVHTAGAGAMPPHGVTNEVILVSSTAQTGTCSDAEYNVAMSASWGDVNSACRTRHLAVRAGSTR
jgi:hypothetical protein